MSMVIANAPNGMAVSISQTLQDQGVKESQVATPCEQWMRMYELWSLVDALWDGTTSLHDPAIARRFLPQYPKEQEQDYVNRLNRSVVTNYYRMTIKRATGKIFKKPLLLNEDVPDAIQELAADIDGCGNDINTFAREVAEAAINYGVTYIMVDWPQLPADLQAAINDPLLGGKAVENDLGVRPYWQHFKPTSIIGWKGKVEGGQYVLTQLRIHEQVMTDSTEDEFEQVSRQRIRVYDIPGRIRLYELQDNEKGEQEWVQLSDTPATINGKPWDRIPLVPISTNPSGHMQARPLLMDMAHLNIAHYQSDSDQRNLLHVTRCPIIFGTGLTEDDDEQFELAVGPFVMNKAPSGATLKFVEHSGQAVKAGHDDIADLEARIGELALSLVLREVPGRNPTATGIAIDTAEADSPLQLVAMAVQQGIDKALDWTAQWLQLGEDMGGTARINSEFGISIGDSTQITALIAARAAGELSRGTFWRELQRRAFLSDDFDSEDEAAQLQIEQSGAEWDALSNLNAPGDETEVADGHSHVLQSAGVTNIVNDHFHQWTPDGLTTTDSEGHAHGLTRGSNRPHSTQAQPQDASGQAGRPGTAGARPSGNAGQALVPSAGSTSTA